MRFLSVLCVALSLAAYAGEGPVRVVDGDTIRIGRERIRIENLDAPELFSPKCEGEKFLGEAAKTALDRLTRDGFVTLKRSGKDRFGRTLARVFVNGRDVGDVLIAQGFARPWRGRTSDWCGGAR